MLIFKPSFNFSIYPLLGFTQRRVGKSQYRAFFQKLSQRIIFPKSISFVIALIAALPLLANPAYAFDYAEPTSDLNEPRFGHTATILKDGSVLVVGGVNNGGQATVELYNRRNNTWTPVGSLNQPRGGHRTLLLNDGKVLVAGGYFQNSPLRSAELYDPATQTWQVVGELNRARNEHTMTLLDDGRVMVIGGYTDDDSTLSSAELYDVGSQSWQLVSAPMTHGRYAHSASLLSDGRVLVAGGLTDDPVEGEIALNSAEIFDPSTQTWAATSNLLSARYAHSATTLQNGQVMVVGGRDDNARLATAEQFDPAANTWSSLASLNTARSGHTASLVVGDALLLIGGLDNSGRLAQNEYFDRTNNLWVEANSLTVARNGHATSVLSSDLILVTGGSGSDGASLASVELYDPDLELVDDSSPGANQPTLRDPKNNVYIPFIQ